MKVQRGVESLHYSGRLDYRLLLTNRAALRIRPLCQHDDGLIDRFYRRLSPQTRYLRFWSPMPDPPDSLLTLITSANDCRRVALVAESDVTDGDEVVALSEVAARDDHTAEVGLVVRDEWQRLGVGTALATRTLQAAEARGFDTFVAEVLLSNVGMMRLLDRIGVVVSKKTRRGVSEFTFVRRTPAKSAAISDVITVDRADLRI